MSEAHPSPLDPRAVAMLALERGWWTTSSSKAEAIRERLGISPTTYYRQLAHLVDDPVALAHDPLVVKRLRRQREERRRRRFEGPSRDRGNL